MNKIKILSITLLIFLGIFIFVYGGYDDSPGAQGLGVLIIIFVIIGLIKSKKGHKLT